MKTYMITTGRKGYDLECQIVVHCPKVAKQEVKDLKAMGCDNVKQHKFDQEAEAYDWLDRAQGII